jgi:hypothetical protein
MQSASGVTAVGPWLRGALEPSIGQIQRWLNTLEELNHPKLDLQLHSAVAELYSYAAHVRLG